MKKRMLSRVLAAAMISCMTLSLGACGGDASGSAGDAGASAGENTAGLTEKIELSFSHHDSSSSVIGQQWEDWAEDIRQASGGMIDITVYAAAALSAPADGINALNSGVCDILWTSTGFFPGQFPATDAVTMPFNGIENAVQGTYVLNEAYGSIAAIEQEWTDKGLKVLILNCAPASYLLSNVKISRPSDAQGTILRAMAGLPTELLTAMGSSAVVSPSGEIFTSMEKGILQGTIFDLAGARGFNLIEVSSSLLDMPLYCTVVPVVMLQSTWDALPAEAQEIIESCSGLQGGLDFAVEYDAYANEYYEQFAREDLLVVPSDSDMAEWEALADEVSAAWIAENNTARLDYQAVVDALAPIIEEYAGVTAPLS